MDITNEATRMPHRLIALSYRKKAMAEEKAIKEKENINMEERKKQLEEHKRFVKEAKESNKKVICFKAEDLDEQEIILNIMIEDRKFVCVQIEPVSTDCYILTFVKKEYQDSFKIH